MCSSSMIHDALGPSCLPAPTFCGLWRDEIEPITGQPWTWAWEFQENWWKLQTFAWPISLHDPSCGPQTSYDPSFQHLHQATFLWPGTQVQLASMSSCEPTYLFAQVWGIGLAGLQVLTSELRIPNQKKLVPITYQCHLRLCLRTFWTFATFCYPGTDFGISRNLPPPLRFHTHNRDNTGLNSERGPNNQEFRNVETLGPQTHTLADSGILSDYRGDDASITCTQNRKPQGNTHTQSRLLV